jgi:hypothetical protein
VLLLAECVPVVLPVFVSLGLGVWFSLRAGGGPGFLCACGGL